MTEVPEADRAVGMLAYATEGAPCSGKAKSSDGDFRVEERLDLSGMVAEAKEGYFPLYKVAKESIDTLHLESQVSEVLKSRVSFGGLKDKRSASVQYFTPTSRKARRPSRFVGDRFAAELVGYLPAPLGRSAVVGNGFRIILRGCCDEIEARAEEVFRAARERRVPNFFGHQRFGSGGGSHLVGRAIVKRRFEEAVSLIIRGEPSPLAGDEVRAAATGEGKGDVEEMVARALLRRPGDWVGALRAVPIRLRRLYVHAYQSYLFNLTVSAAMASGEDIASYEPGDNWGEAQGEGLGVSRARGVRDPPAGSPVPLVQLMGYAFRNYGSRFDRCLLEVAEDEGVAAREFYVEDMQECSAEGGFRRPHIAIEGGAVVAATGTAELAFTLGRGMYATVLLREVLKPDDPEMSGLG